MRLESAHGAIHARLRLHRVRQDARSPGPASAPAAEPGTRSSSAARRRPLPRRGRCARDRRPAAEAGAAARGRGRALAARLLTGIGELDRVLGGGLVPGSLVLLGGAPGIGKSTLASMALANVGAGGAKTHLRLRARSRRRRSGPARERLGEAALEVPVLAEPSLEAVLARSRPSARRSA